VQGPLARSSQIPHDAGEGVNHAGFAHVRAVQVPTDNPMNPQFTTIYLVVTGSR